MLDTGHPGKHLGTLQVVSIFAFLPENASWVCFLHLYAPCDVIAMKMMTPSGRAHPSYIVSNSEANWTNVSRDTANFVSYPSP